MDLNKRDEPQIIADRITLEFPVVGGRRLIPSFRRKGEKRNSDSRVGGDFILSRNRSVVRSLDDVTFTLNPGDRLGVIGPNGAGKTTLLMTLAGIYWPTEGTIKLRGAVDALLNIRLGFRGDATGRRNIYLRGMINGWTPEEIETRVESIIQFSELGDFIDMPFKSYSQGMAARLAFSIATAISPDILLLDEWIGAGDADFQRKAAVRMNAFVDNAGILVIASHSTGLLQSVCNLGMVLDHGRVKAFGPIEEILKEVG